MIELHRGMSTFRAGRRRRRPSVVLDIMDGQNQKYINCLDRLHVITAGGGGGGGVEGAGGYPSRGGDRDRDRGDKRSNL